MVHVQGQVMTGMDNVVGQKRRKIVFAEARAAALMVIVWTESASVGMEVVARDSFHEEKEALHGAPEVSQIVSSAMGMALGRLMASATGMGLAFHNIPSLLQISWVTLLLLSVVEV